MLNSVFLKPQADSVKKTKSRRSAVLLSRQFWTSSPFCSQCSMVQDKSLNFQSKNHSLEAMFSCFDWRRPPFRRPKNPSISCRKSSKGLEALLAGANAWRQGDLNGAEPPGAAFWLVSWERDHSWILVFSSLLVSTIPEVIRQSNRLLLLQSLWIPQPGFCWYPYEFSIQPRFFAWFNH